MPLDQHLHQEGTRIAFYGKLILLLGAVFFVRPSAMGNEYTSIGVALVFIAFLLHLMDVRYRNGKIKFSRQNAIVFLSVLLLFSYIGLQALLVPNHENIESIIKTVMANVILLFFAALILSDESAKKLFFQWFTWLTLFTCVSVVVTFILTAFMPLENLFLFQIRYGSSGGYQEAGQTYFPFTTIYGVLNYEQLSLPRFLGLFRESGLTQMFILWMLYNLESLDLNKLWVKIVLVVGLIFTFSTAGIAFLFINLVAKCVINLKLWRAVLLGIVAYIAILHTPFIGINDKIDTGHGTSVSDRQQAMVNAWTSLQENPMGVGFNNNDNHNSGINLLAASNMIGIVGFLLCLCVYFSGITAVGNKKRYFLSVLPIVLTSLLSQPILDAPLVYIMFLAPYVAATAERGAQDKAALLPYYWSRVRSSALYTSKLKSKIQTKEGRVML